jgi:hypothetical protein
MSRYILIPNINGTVHIDNAGQMIADALDEREKLINALLLAKPIICEVAAKVRPQKKIAQAMEALEAMYQWPELFE